MPSSQCLQDATVTQVHPTRGAVPVTALIRSVSSISAYDEEPDANLLATIAALQAADPVVHEGETHPVRKQKGAPGKPKTVSYTGVLACMFLRITRCGRR